MRSLKQLRSAASNLALLIALVAAAGCADDKKSLVSKIPLHYQELPAKNVPEYLKDTILERCDLTNTQPFRVSSFGLVVNLHGTGDTFAGSNVRDFIIKEMVSHQFGSKVFGFEHLKPEDVLTRTDVAIVQVDGFIPPGARKRQRFDVSVRALDGNNTSSLSHGMLYRTDLKVDGANLLAPGHSVDIWATGEGSIFVNPAYAMLTSISEAEVRNSLRQGVVLGGGVVNIDRPLTLRVRKPQLSIARSIQFRLNQAFQKQSAQDTPIAAAKDEALISLYVPDKYGSEWEHFAQVAMHLYVYSSADYTVVKAKQLAAEAVKPDAPLLDISYCWEAMGPLALPYVAPLITNEKPEIAFAAARAASFMGDVTAQTALMQMARNNAHPFQLGAVEALGQLPSSPIINQMLRSLIDSDKNVVRVQAYRALAEHGDSSVISKQVGQKFMLDIVPSSGPPVIWASRTGLPRIAVIGNRPQVDLPTLFTAIDNRLMITSEQSRPLLNLYYRGAELPQPVSITCPPDVDVLIARLGGEGPVGDAKLQFNYCDVVALMQTMSDQKRLSAQVDRQRVPVAFVLQEAPRVLQSIEEAPVIPDKPIPAGDKIGSAADSGAGQLR